MKLPFKKPVVVSIDDDLPEFVNFEASSSESKSYFSRASDISLSSDSEGESEQDRQEIAYGIGLDLIDQGLVPTPLVGKRPIIKGWQKTTLENAEKKLSEASNYNNVGILTGKPSNITVVDIDGKEGLKNFRKVLKAANLKSTGKVQTLFDTYTVKTGRNGYHIYFKYVGDTLSSAPLRKKKSQHINVDIKNDGGQVVAAGSIHPDTGKEYRVINDSRMRKMPRALKNILEEYQIS